MNAIANVSYAKINLGLEVLYKRGDGFHAINTVFVRVSLADAFIIGMEPIKENNSSAVTVHCTPSLGIPQEENLTYKAARVLQEDAIGHLSLVNGADAEAIKNDVRIALQKKIPTGGGLGGGSSNAASVLAALPALWDVGVETAHIHAIAARLGSDVPFFVQNVPCAIGTGRGEALTPLGVRLPYWIVLVCPEIHVSTPWAYNALRRSGDTNVRRASDYGTLLPQAVENAALFRQHFVNDFEEAVFKEYPILGRIKSTLYEQGALFALMSGSGSTVFGLFAEKEAASRAAAAWSAYTIFLCQNV